MTGTSSTRVSTTRAARTRYDDHTHTRAHNVLSNKPNPRAYLGQEVEYLAADGTMRRMGRQELEAKLQQQQQEGGVPGLGPDGSLSKETQGKATLEEVSV